MSQYIAVAPREGRVSRNPCVYTHDAVCLVAPREGRVSRNAQPQKHHDFLICRAPRGACE